jgi:hypothetical protein
MVVRPPFQSREPAAVPVLRFPYPSERNEKGTQILRTLCARQAAGSASHIAVAVDPGVPNGSVTLGY